MKENLTKKDYFSLLLDIVINSNHPKKNELYYFLNSQIASIENKALKEKNRRENNNNIKENIKDILSLLTEDFQTADDILNKLTNSPMTIAQIRGYLTQLVKDNLVDKTDIIINGKIKKAYKIKERI